MMMKYLFSAIIMTVLSGMVWADMFDAPTGLEIKADERAKEIMRIPRMQEKADRKIDRYISSPENLMIIEHSTRSHEKMGKPEIASHITLPELLDQELKNPVVEAEHAERMLLLKGVSGKIMVNKTLFEQSDVNTFFTNQEMKKIEKILEDKNFEAYMTSTSFDAMFFGYNY
jgi:hypothetical protein